MEGILQEAAVDDGPQALSTFFATGLAAVALLVVRALVRRFLINSPSSSSSWRLILGCAVTYVLGGLWMLYLANLQVPPDTEIAMGFDRDDLLRMSEILFLSVFAILAVLAVAEPLMAAVSRRNFQSVSVPCSRGWKALYAALVVVGVWFLMGGREYTTPEPALAGEITVMGLSKSQVLVVAELLVTVVVTVLIALWGIMLLRSLCPQGFARREKVAIFVLAVLPIAVRTLWVIRQMT